MALAGPRRTETTSSSGAVGALRFFGSCAGMGAVPGLSWLRGPARELRGQRERGLQAWPAALPEPRQQGLQRGVRGLRGAQQLLRRTFRWRTNLHRLQRTRTMATTWRQPCSCPAGNARTVRQRATRFRQIPLVDGGLAALALEIRLFHEFDSLWLQRCLGTAIEPVSASSVPQTHASLVTILAKPPITVTQIMIRCRRPRNATKNRPGGRARSGGLLVRARHRNRPRIEEEPVWRRRCLLKEQPCVS
jgi:hypothetical protein